MDAELEKMVRELYDRQQIRDVVVNYCRGVDRMDRDLLMSCYHPDAIDDHGFFVEGPEAFWEWVNHYHCNAQIGHQHIVTNHTCELDGDVAHTETYWIFAGMDAKDFSLSLGGGRYLDRMEKRDGVWKIAARKCLAEWGGAPTESKVPPEVMAMLREGGVVARDSTDSSYERPLTIQQDRIGKNLNILPPEYEPS